MSGRVPRLATMRRRIPGLQCLLFCDGRTSPKDWVHNLAATMAGGVGGAWTEESNYRLVNGLYAPVIAEATDNLLSDENASFEGGTIGDWLGGTRSIIATDSWHGAKCLKCICGSVTEPYLNVTAVTAPDTQYTFSAYAKAGNAGMVGHTPKAELYDAGAGYQQGAGVALTTEWQRIKITATFGAGAARYIMIGNADGTWCHDNDILYIDAVQLEAKAYDTPFALDARTACGLSLPAASLGLTAGQAFSIKVAANTSWAGNDGVGHYFLDNYAAADGTNNIRLRKGTNNVLYFQIYDATPALRQCYTAALDATTWAANTDHLIRITRSGAGVMDAYLDGVRFDALGGAVNDGAGTGLEAALGANLSVGSRVAGTPIVNGALAVAIYNRVSPDDISQLPLILRRTLG